MLLGKYNSMQRNNYVGPLDKYFGTKTLQRLKGKGLFCGMDYMTLMQIKPREYYSRFDHSRNVSYSAWPLSEDLKVALAGAFHDSGSLSFAHVNSFKKGEALTQENDELNVKSILLQDDELLTYLSEDKIKLDDVVDYSRYPLLDKSIPALCLDRVDGILATCLFWAKTHSIKKIKELYCMLTYFENLNGMNFDMSSERLMEFNGEIVLSENGIDVPNGVTVQKIEDGVGFFPKFSGNDVVVKPKSTNFGKGVVILKQPYLIEDFKNAINQAFKYDSSVMIEEFIKGKEYRFLVIADEVAAILHRVPANVIGNGANTIEELVAEKNKSPLRGHGYVTPLEKITLGQINIRFLYNKKEPHKCNRKYRRPF
jgi:D-alanine-D-alanine ligase-like ATP-grasp enzyme